MAFKTDEGWEESILSMLWRWAVTLAVIVVLIGLSVFPFRIGVLGEIRPSFMIMAVYYWAVMRPQAMTPPAVFLMGILFDEVAKYPLGLTALTLVLVQWITGTQRKFLLGQPFL